ncbi:hypothetical protein M8O61_001708 [Campylobacter coli]|nr:hypothetical protein [Campylobacter coli]
MLSLILNMDVRYFLFILIFIAVICFLLWKSLEEELNFTSKMILICLSLIFIFASYKFYDAFYYKENSAKEEAVQNYIQTIENKIDPRFKDKIKEQFSSIPNTFGFNLCYENNYTGKTCLNYLFYFENKIKDEVKKAREEFFKSRDINNNINDKFNKGEKMNQEIKNVEVPMNENAYKKWQRVPKDMQEKAIEAALTMLWRDEVFFYTFFNGHIEEGEIRIEAKREEKVEFPY